MISEIFDAERFDPLPIMVVGVTFVVVLASVLHFTVNFYRRSLAVRLWHIDQGSVFANEHTPVAFGVARTAVIKVSLTYASR